jgi:hypothetical protein
MILVGDLRRPRAGLPFAQEIDPMTDRLDPPLTSRNGGLVRVLAVCRIGGVNPTLEALDDQEALLRRPVADHHDGRAEWQPASSRASGELPDGEESLAIGEDLKSGRSDLPITDLGRVARRHRVIDIGEIAEDGERRVIGLDDRVAAGRGDRQAPAMSAPMGPERSDSGRPED